MVKRCCIASCKNTNKTEPGRNKTYHKFPSCSDVLRKLWLQFLHDDPHSKKKGISVDSSFICSNHFSTDCYKTYTFRKTLERESIPSVYMIHGKRFFWLGHPAAVATYKASLDDIPSFPVVTSSTDAVTASHADHISSVDGVVIINQKSTSPGKDQSQLAPIVSQDIAERVVKNMRQKSTPPGKDQSQLSPSVSQDIAERIVKNMRQESTAPGKDQSQLAPIVSQDIAERVVKNMRQKSTSPGKDQSQLAPSVSQDIAKRIVKNMRQEHSYSNSDGTKDITPRVRKKKHHEHSYSNSNSDVVTESNPSVSQSQDIAQRVKKEMTQEHSYSHSVIAGTLNSPSIPQSQNATESGKKEMRQENSYSNFGAITQSSPNVSQSEDITKRVKKKIRRDNTFSPQDVTIIEYDPSDSPDTSQPEDISEKVKKKMIQEHSYSISNRGETQRIANKKLKEITKPKKQMKLVKISVEKLKPKENLTAPRKQVLKFRNVFSKFKQNQKVEVLEKQVQLLQTSVEKLTRNVQNINEVLKELKKSEALSENGQKLIEKIIAEPPSE